MPPPGFEPGSTGIFVAAGLACDRIALYHRTRTMRALNAFAQQLESLISLAGLDDRGIVFRLI